MKRLLYTLAVALIGTGSFSGCQEAEIIPEGPGKNAFLEPHGATPAELQVMKQFFNTNGVYVLFNDLLEKKSLGTNSSGIEVFRDVKLDMSYGMTSVTSNIFEYDFLETIEEKEAAATFITEKFLPSLSQNMRPYSLLLVNEIKQYTFAASTGYALTRPTVFSGWRSTAIAVKGVDQMTEQQQVAYKMSLLRAIVNRGFQSVDQTVFNEFYSYSAAYHAKFSFNPLVDFPGLTLAALSDVRNTGMLTAYAYNAPGGSWANGFVNFKARNLDLTDFIDLVFTKTDEEIRAEHGAFPSVIKKYEALKAVILELGVIL